MPIRRVFRVFLAVLAALPLAGCLEVDQQFALNPDGSGKVTHTMITAFHPAMMQQFMPEDSEDAGSPEEFQDGFAAGFRDSFAEKMQAQSEGIEAWAPATSEELDDGRVMVSMTGYFPDVSKVRISGGIEEEDEEASVPFYVSELPDGRRQINFLGPAAGESERDAAEGASDEEVAKRIQEERASWQFAKAIMGAMLGSMKVQTALTVPGRIESVSDAVQRKSDSVAGIAVTGPQILEAVEKSLMDDDAAARALRHHEEIFESLSESEGDLFEQIFGDSDPRFVFTPSSEPVFDYDAEVRAAKAAAAAEGDKSSPGDEDTESNGQEDASPTKPADVVSR